jgi:hypothetical protein
MSQLLILFTFLLLTAACVKPIVYEPWCNDWQILVRDALTGDGKVSASYEGAWHPGEMTPDKYGNRPHFDYIGAHVGILEIHPVSPAESAKLKFTGIVSSQTPILTVVGGGSIHGDCLLQLYVNGSKISEYVLDGLKWTKCRFDLTNYSGQTADLQLWITAGGAKPWNYENCFIDDISFTEGRKF